MASISRRNGHREASAWPGWVDALSSLVMVVIFLLMVFIVAQFYMATALTGRNEQLTALNHKVAELNDLLALERDANADLRVSTAQLSAELQSSVAARDSMTTKLSGLQGDLEAANRAAEELQRTVRVDREAIELKLREIASLQADLKTLRDARDKLEGQLAEAATKLTMTDEQRQALLSQLGAARDRSKALESSLADAQQKTMLAQKEIDQRDIRLKDLTAALGTEQGKSADANKQVDLLNQQMAALRDQLARISAALDVSEKKAEEQKIQIANLGSRLNEALAAKVQDLARYRSEFFGRMKEALGNRPDIRIVGDRFVFQSELLFPSGSADLQDAGKQRLVQLAQTLKAIETQIPSDIDWILQVNGHTDIRPVRLQFASNWELSTARAISVVKFLIDQGIAPERLSAAGYGEYQPIDSGTSDEALARNRRIEIKLTQR